MRDFFSLPYDGKPILVCGKGPSFSKQRLLEQDIVHFSKVTLNHCIREIEAEFAHVIDFDVIKDCQEAIYKNAKYLVMPYYPHFGCRAVPEVPLSKIVESHEFLKKMDKEGRILCYNLSTVGPMHRVGNSPVIKAKAFSAEAVVDLMAKWGARTIRTVGVDGGNQQSSSFSDLQNLNNEHGYDRQWRGIRKTIQKFNLDYAPIGVESPIRIFVGAGEKQIIPAMVLKHSILKHATMSVDVTIMSDWTHPMPKDPRNRPRTPFSFQRFMIPEKISGGMGIYMDSDMVVFGDVKEIWTEPTNEGLLTMRHDDIDKHRAKFAVCRYDGYLYHPTIKEIVDGLDSGKWTYEDVVFDFKHEIMGIRDGFNPDWNSLEEYTEGKTKLLHYTEMYNQPWLVNPNHPLGYLWFNELKESISDGSIDREIVEDHVSKKWLLQKCLEVL